MKIVLVGAGSAQFGSGMLGDIFASKELVGSHIVLHDINETALNKMLSVANRFITEHKLNYTITASTNRKEAFQSADFIISSIEVGNRFALWEDRIFNNFNMAWNKCMAKMVVLVEYFTLCVLFLQFLKLLKMRWIFVQMPIFLISQTL